MVSNRSNQWSGMLESQWSPTTITPRAQSPKKKALKSQNEDIFCRDMERLPPLFFCVYCAREESYNLSIFETFGEGFMKKCNCYFGFCPNYLDPPPPPNLDNLYHFFWTPMCQKNLGGSPPPQIDPIYTVCEKWTKHLGRALPPPHLDKIQKKSSFFRETFP